MMSENQQPQLEANFSTLVLSIGSSAAMAMGLAPNPSTGKVEKDLEMAKFNIDLLAALSDKTKGNLSKEEGDLLTRMLADLQMKYVQEKK